MAVAHVAAGQRLAVLAAASGAAALAWAGVAILAVDPGAADPTTYAGALPAARVADILAGLGLILAGGLACTRPQARRLGALAMLAGIAWFGADWAGSEPALVRSVGAVAMPFLLAIVFHLALAAPNGRLRTLAARAATAAAYAIAAAVSLGDALVRDPLLDLNCWRSCRSNVFLVHPDPGIAAALDDISRWSSLAIGPGLVVLAALRLRTATAPGRRVLLPLLGPAMLVAASEAAYAGALLLDAAENPHGTAFATIFVARAASLCALAGGIVWSVVVAWRTRAAVSRLAVELGEAPPAGGLRDGFAAALRDPDLEVFYWLAESQRFVAADGRAATPPLPGDDRAVTPMTRAGRRLAVVAHDRVLLQDDELELQIGSAARLAIDNERLQAEVLAQLEDLRASRTRIVEHADAERRRLERNLHDGAQQRLIAVSYDLRLTRAGLEHGDDPELAPLLAHAAAEVNLALGELRELAHGIYPAILNEAGLEPALRTLADGAPIALELGDVPSERYAPAAETVAYFAVEEAMHDAAERGAGYTAVTVTRVADRLVVAVEDDGAERRSPLQRVADRVGAVGGSLAVGPTTIRAELPCA